MKNRLQRSLRGEYHWKAKLTDSEVKMIRDMREEGVSISRLAEIFETSGNTIQNICLLRRRRTNGFGEVL